MKQNRLPITFVRAPIVSKIGNINNEATPAIGFAYLSGYLRRLGYDPLLVDAIGAHSGVESALPIQPALPTTIAEMGRINKILIAAALRPSLTFLHAIKRMIRP